MGTWRPGKIWKAKVKLREKKRRENYGNIRENYVDIGENYGNIRENYGNYCFLKSSD